MSFLGNSTNITTTITKGNLQEFKAKQECKTLLGEYASAKLMEECIANKLSGSTTTKLKTYAELTELQKDATPGVSVASKEDWSKAWKALQVEQMKRNIQLEDSTDPTPLLIDKISSLPADSARRRSAENIKGTLDGTAANVGYGMDNLTRESYKEIKRIVKHSDMLQREICHRDAIPSSNQILGGISVGLPSVKQILGAALGNTSPDLAQVLGLEEGQYTSNLQNWKPYFVNAVRPLSDALGSHSDIDHGIYRNSGGTSSFIPRSIASSLDKISSTIVDHTEGIFKSQQIQMIQNLPSKLAGSLRQLSTALDSILAVPFEIMSDMYNGLMSLVNQIADLIDAVLNKIISFIFSVLGGLVDSIFPISQLESLLEPILEIAGELSDIFDLFGGFPAMAKISSVLSIVSGGFASILTNLPFLYQLFKTKTITKTITNQYNCITEIFDLSVTSVPPVPKSLKVLSAIGGVISTHGSLGAGIQNFGAGLGNLGSMIIGGVSNKIGSLTLNIRNFTGLLADLLPGAIGRALHWLTGKLCNLGIVGDLGFSVGDVFDFLTDSSFSKAMGIYATHHSIVAPLFGKEAIPRGSYSQESALAGFYNSSYVIGAQGNKGITMVGPGASIGYKPFGLSQGSYSIGGYYRTSSTTNTIFR
jgi:hypothetical protein